MSMLFGGDADLRGLRTAPIMVVIRNRGRIYVFDMPSRQNQFGFFWWTACRLHIQTGMQTRIANADASATIGMIYMFVSQFRLLWSMFLCAVLMFASFCPRTDSFQVFCQAF